MNIFRLLPVLLLTVSPVLGAMPAVEAVLELPRTEAVHYVDAVLSLVDLGKAELAEPITEALVALELDDAARVELVAEAGAARLLRLAREVPETLGWVNAALQAASSAATSPERLGELVKRLTTGSGDDARKTLLELERTGTAGVAFCLVALAEADNPKHEARLREALVTLYPESGPALTVGLWDENVAVRTQTAYAWGRLADLDRLRSGIGSASPLPTALLTGPALLAPSGDSFGEAARWSYSRLTGQPANSGSATPRLRQAIDELLTGRVPFPSDGDGLIPWRTQREEPLGRRTVREVGIAIAAPLAADLARLSHSASDERMALLLATEAGLELTDFKLTDLPTHAMSAALADALAQPFPTAAVACCRALGERRDAAALASGGGKLSPLAQALESSHAAVRFAALEAVMTINPQASFPGSSRVADALTYFANATGERRVLVAAPQISRAANLAGYLAASGYAAMPVNRGSDTVTGAEATPDVELVLLDLATIRPSARETLFQLRRTPTTANLPVGLLAADGRYAEAQAIADDHNYDSHSGRVLVSARLHSVEATATFTQQLARLAPRTNPTPDTRREQATKARGWIQQLLEENRNLYRLRANPHALLTILAEGGDLQGLVELGTPDSQLLLLDQASYTGAPIEGCRTAAEAFAASVERHGVLLTSGQIRRQYDRYNASETAGADIQEVLGTVLDAIESRRK